MLMNLPITQYDFSVTLPRQYEWVQQAVTIVLANLILIGGLLRWIGAWKI
jgi:hypothetical protein